MAALRSTLTDSSEGSQRRADLLELAYRYALEHGLADVSLRPLATAVGSSPRVLLYLFGSKDGLVRALLARARADEVAMLADLRGRAGPDVGLQEMAEEVWRWLAAAEHRSLLVLWVEAYARSLVVPDGPWGGFAQLAVEDWLALLATAQPSAVRRTQAGLAQRRAVLAVLRGALLDVLATGDAARTTAAVRHSLGAIAV